MSALKMKVLGFMVIMLSISAIAKGDENENENESSSKPPILVKMVKGKKMCVKDWECNVLSRFCCNLTISDFFETYQFENLFSKRNSPVAHSAGFWDYKSFIIASALFQPLGFGTTGGKFMQMKEIAAFLGHVGSKTSCKLLFCSKFSSIIWLFCCRIVVILFVVTCSVCELVWIRGSVENNLFAYQVG